MTARRLLLPAALALFAAPPALAQPEDDPRRALLEAQDGETAGPDAEADDTAVERAGQELSSRPGSTALLRGLDKVTARTEDFEAPVGTPVTFGSLEITVRYCRKRPPEEPPEVYAFVEAVDRRTDGFGEEADGETIFSGWMFASSPALNPLEHPVYDVWVIDCRA